MKTGSIFTSMLVGVMATGIAVAAGGKAHWGYEGHQGPSHWGELAKSYHTCASGVKQSPIDISGASADKLDSIKTSYKGSRLDVVNNGHTIQVNIAKGSSMSVNGKTYNLLQFHFHVPSEHTINGKHADMVAHLVHQAADGQLGVIGVLFNKGKKNNEIAKVWKNMPKYSGGHNTGSATINARNLLPKNMAYYNYSGSLTTPPCSEGVNWMVLQDRSEVSAEQITAFTQLFAKSVRPVQPLNKRIVKRGG